MRLSIDELRCRGTRSGFSRVMHSIACAWATASLLTAPARAQEPGMVEMRIAEQHAAAAAASSDLEETKTELQKALNCLVGRDAPEFRSKAGDPCKGASASQTLPSRSVNRIRVGKAVRLASVGVTFHDFKPAHFTAQAVQAVLEEGTQQSR